MIPRLITAAVAQFQTLGRAVSAPQLHSSRKKRSSRRYLPSSPEPPLDNVIMANQIPADRDNNIEVDSEGQGVNDILVLHSIGHAQEAIWSRRRREVVESENEDFEGEDSEGEDSKGDNSAGEDSGDEGYYDWEGHDDLEGPSGLSALDRIGECFECSVAVNGESSSTNATMQPKLIITGKQLGDADLTILRAYAYKIDTHTTDSAFKKLPFAFPQEPIPTVDVCRTRLRFLSGFKPEKYHCCINTCCCFVGPHSNCHECLYCHKKRYKEYHNGKKQPQICFNYLPIIPRLTAMYANTKKAEEMRYHGFEHEHTPRKIKDVFDSHIYRCLLGKRIIIDQEEASHTYFSSP